MFANLVLITLIFHLLVAEARPPNQWFTSPHNKYRPNPVPCPAGPIFRRADNTLSKGETEWLAKRKKKTGPALENFLRYTAKLSDEEISQVVQGENTSVVISLAPSGGSFRALLTGAGELSALDNRTKGAFEHGLGGLLQSSTYLAGLSGSSWLVGSLAANDYPVIDDILSKREIWNLKHSFYNIGGIDVAKTLHIWRHIFEEVQAKKKRGFDITATDIYGRLLARQLFNNSYHHGVNATFSLLRERGSIASGDMPLPIIQAEGKPTENDVSIQDSTVFEMNPFEFGSWESSGNGFIDMKYLGSRVTNGKASECVVNFDNTGFLVGTSSSMFDSVLATLEDGAEGVKLAAMLLVKKWLKPFIVKKDEIAIFDRNPFYKSTTGVSPHLRESKALYLVDGGEDNQKIPLPPLIRKQRNVDVVMAYDLGAETDDFWPGGQSLMNSYDRQYLKIGKDTAVPYIPDDVTMLALNYTHKPVFFGCDAKNLTKLDHIPPLIVYAANTKYSYNSNSSTLQFKYTEEEFRGHIRNGFEIATYGNKTEDSEFATCVGCAVIRRAQERQGIEQSEQCQKCFSRYCWDGTTVSQGQLHKYLSRKPSQRLDEIKLVRSLRTGESKPV